jgi:amidase
MREVALLDATAQAELVRAGEVSAEELIDAAIDAVERLDPELNAVIHRRFDEARSEIAAAGRDAPFFGVPYLVKDLGASGQVDGSPFHRGNRALRDAGFVYRGGDSAVVRRLRDAGFAIIGKTNTPELGFSATTEPEAYGPTHNPWDTTRTPAGSSGGSAAAVSAGVVPAAGASDGGGSIRMPASACGLVGLKVSRGRVSSGPHSGAPGGGNSVEHCLTTSVRDTAALLDVLAGPEPGDPVIAPAPTRPFAAEVGAEPGRLRVGYRTDGLLGPVHADCVAAVEDVARLLEELGHDVESSWPEAIDDPTAGFEGIMPAHAAGTAVSVERVARDLGRAVTAADFEARTWGEVESGRGFDAPQVLLALELVIDWSRRIARWWADRDVLMTPTLGIPPPPLGYLSWEDPDALMHMVEFSPFCSVWNWTGQPAISLPLGESSEGLPIGVMLVGAYGREDLLLRLAAQLETARPWRDRRPPLHAARPDPARAS